LSRGSGLLVPAPFPAFSSIWAAILASFSTIQDRPRRGQLLELPDDDPALLRRLDAYEGFDPARAGTSFFRRVPATATLADGRSAACDVYVYNRPTAAAARVIACGDWRRVTSSPPPRRTEPPCTSDRSSAITTATATKKPSRYELPGDYAKSIERAGGLPILLPFRSDLSLIPEYADLVDGVLFSGGNDLDPSLYGETWHPNACQSIPIGSASSWRSSRRSSACRTPAWACAWARSS
jgi:hypothetical protein